MKARRWYVLRDEEYGVSPVVFGEEADGITALPLAKAQADRKRREWATGTPVIYELVPVTRKAKK